MKQKKYVIDLDGTLAYWESGFDDLTKIGDPLPGAVEFVNELAKDGSKITIFTRRMAGDITEGLKDFHKMYSLIRDWLDKHGFIWHDIYSGPGKPDGTAFIDDRGVACRPQDNPNAYAEALVYVKKNILKE